MATCGYGDDEIAVLDVAHRSLSAAISCFERTAYRLSDYRAVQEQYLAQPGAPGKTELTGS